MPQKWERIATALAAAKLFTPLSSRVHARALFMCEYCDRYMLDQLDSWHGFACDHILPQSVYPNLIKDENNIALSCKACNDLKRNWDLTKFLPASDQQNWKELDKLTPDQRQEFIIRCKDELVGLREEAMKNIELVKKILRDQVRMEESSG